MEQEEKKEYKARVCDNCYTVIPEGCRECLNCGWTEGMPVTRKPPTPKTKKELSAAVKAVRIIVLVLLLGAAGAAFYFFGPFWEQQTEGSAADADAHGESAEEMLERLIGVKYSFKPVYNVREQNRLDFITPRLRLRITVPRNLSREQLDKNVRHSLLTAYKKSPVKLGVVGVFAYSEGTDIKKCYSAAKAEFAPGGEWGKADHTIPIGRWRVTLKIQEAYFEPPVVPLKPGVICTTKEPAKLTRKAESWNDNEVVGNLDKGVKVKILDIYTYDIGMGKTLVRYRVEAKRKGRKLRGWAHAYFLKETK